MSPSPSVAAKQGGVPLWFWFVGFGIVDIAIALIAAYVLHAPPAVLRILLPTLVLFFDPSTPQGAALFIEGAILFGGSFVIWGMVGLLVGVAVRLGRSMIR